MQGTVLSNIKCSIQIDSLGKDCITENKGIYKYKGCTSIPPLSMVDDVVTISNCGVDSIKVNAIVQAKVETKQLDLGHTKCFNMHIGKKDKHLCPSLSIHGAEMLTSDRETYLGDLLTTDNKIDQNIIARCNKGMGKINGIISLLQEVSFGPHYFKMAILFRSSMLLSSKLCNSEVLYGITKSHIKKNLNKLTGYSSKDCSRCLTVLQLKPSILKHQLFLSDIFSWAVALCFCGILSIKLNLN